MNASTAAMLKGMLIDPGYTIQWTLISIIVPLLPIVFSIYLARLLSTSNRWYATIKEGELYVVSITLAATTLSLAGINSLAAYCLLVLLITSAIMYGISAYIKIGKQTLDPAKERGFCMVSINLTFLTIIFCFILTNFGKLK